MREVYLGYILVGDDEDNKGNMPVAVAETREDCMTKVMMVITAMALDPEVGPPILHLSRIATRPFELEDEDVAKLKEVLRGWYEKQGMDVVSLMDQAA